MTIDLKKFGSTLISRQSGKEAYAAFQSSLKGVLDNEDVVVDFKDVITFSPSWGDEFITPLAERFSNRLKLAHTENPSVHTSLQILERSNNIKFNTAQI